MIKAICFDLDGVYFTPYGKQSFHRALSAEFGADPLVVDEIMYRSQVMRDLVTGQITPTDFWHSVRTETGITATDIELVTRWVRDYEIDADVRRVVAAVREQGFLTCVCTNNNIVRLSALENKFHFYQDFDVLVSSHEVGYTKPSPEIFLALLEKLAIEPNALLYADDNEDRLSGAKQLGINVFVYKNFPQFLSTLEEYGVKID